jgi:fructose-bisphosphate aldolase class I
MEQIRRAMPTMGTKDDGPAMEHTIAAMLASGKGLLAADESLPTIEKRFKALNIPCNEESRRAYRELLFTAPAIGEFISGAILFDETIHQKTRSGAPMAEVLARQGIVPGIKVDGGTAALPGFPGEKFTQGLDGLRERLAAYREMGARFAKWRSVIDIGAGLPTEACVRENARSLAMYAALCQEAKIVPIVEPEVLMDGAHTIARCEEVTGQVLRAVFASLFEHRVMIRRVILKSGMVLSGKDCPQQADDTEAAQATLRCFRQSVPAALPGIVFLSGGQDDVPATRRLNAICRAEGAPWKLTFSYGRALQDEPMKTWAGSPSNAASAQAALYHRARCNGLAATGAYTAADERAGRT